MQDLLTHFIQFDGSGAWIQGFCRISTYRKLNAMNSCRSINAIAASSNQHDIIELTVIRFPTSSLHISKPNPFCISSTEAVASSTTNSLRMTSGVRVIELREHHLGIGGFIAIVEYVRNCNGYLNKRYVVRDVYRLCQIMMKFPTTTTTTTTTTARCRSNKAIGNRLSSYQCDSVELLDEKVLFLAGIYATH